MSHYTSVMREDFIDRFEGPNNEWLENFGSPQQAVSFLGKFWHCTDVVPSYCRYYGAEWLRDHSDIDEDKLDDLERGCTYAQLVQIMKRVLSSN